METAATRQATSPPPPRHIAIIMDGNGRWAAARGLPRIAGHRRGAEAARETVRGCIELGVEYLTLYVFSSENWKRPVEEVRELMGLLRLYLRRELDSLADAGVRLRIIGKRDGLDEDIRFLVSGAEARTGANRALTLTVALNYGGRAEIAAAARAIARGVEAGRIDPERIDTALFSAHLQTSGLPDPDLVIRTSGERRLSNFLLWQCAYSELVFTPVLWPDFDRASLQDAIGEFQARERRYGGAGA